LTGASIPSIYNYAKHTLALKSFLQRPGDGRQRPSIPAATLAWALLLGVILRLGSALRLEWLASCGNRKQMGLARPFGDDAIGYFTERVDPYQIRARLAATLQLARRNKVFDRTPFIGFALDGTGFGHTGKSPCPLCHPIKNAEGDVTGHNHSLVMIAVVGAEVCLPFDVEPYGPGDSEYAAGQRLLKRAVERLGPRFARYVAVDAKFATAPFLHVCSRAGIPVVARLKANLPELAAAVQARFSGQPPSDVFMHGKDRIEIWDAADFTPWQALDWESVRVIRYRQHKPNGTVVEADWLSNFSITKLPSRLLFKFAKSRWEIENQGFNDAKNLCGIEHIQHHDPNSMLVNWLFLLLALLIERLYRTRFLRRGDHKPPTAMELYDALRCNLRCSFSDTS
jgi:hypothetical protein